MDYIIICSVALIVAALTLFSGFGLGTLLMPAFAIFFPVEIAIAATAVVHLANNIFKLILVGRRANLKIVLLFAIPAAIFAVFGALLLNATATMEPLIEYSIGTHNCIVTPSKLVIAILMVLFSLVELVPGFNKLSFSPKLVPVGGILSGFFGGLSGHQGALRTAFLINLGLKKEIFIGTIVLSAVVVDISRLAVYGSTFFMKHFATLSASGGTSLVIAGTVAAFAGSFIGSRLVKKITMRAIQLIVGIMLLSLALALGSGII